MPAAGAKRTPPKNCPICRQSIWSRDKTRNVYEAWDVYNSHVGATHPEYQRWNSRMSWNYIVVILLFIVPPFLAVFGSPDTARLLFIFGWSLAFVALATILLVKKTGRTSFRRLWSEGHGAPVDRLDDREDS